MSPSFDFNGIEKIEVGLEAGQTLPCRIDVYLARRFSNCSRSFFQKLISMGAIEVNNSALKSKNFTLKGGEILTFRRDIIKELEKTCPTDSTVISDVNISSFIISEDEDIIIVNKPAGLVVHPACGHPDGTLADMLESYSQGVWKPYLAHRLDKDTTGVLVVAKNERARDILVKQFKNRTVEKNYIAIVKGKVNFKKAVIDAPLGRNPSNRFITSVGEGSKLRDSYTEAEKIFEGSGWSVLLVKPMTGRTHQIRAHFAFIKHPILGDIMYGGTKEMSGDFVAQRPLLHAYSISFNHPADGKRVKYIAPLPDDMISIAPELKKVFG